MQLDVAATGRFFALRGDKIATEQLGDVYWRNFGVSALCLRYCGSRWSVNRVLGQQSLAKAAEASP